jgi:hypothetical protein
MQPQRLRRPSYPGRAMLTACTGFPRSLRWHRSGSSSRRSNGSAH